MDSYKPITSFGKEHAEIYDEVSQREDTSATLAFLEQLAGGGPALELAIGTGRVALPLAARGIRVDDPVAQRLYESHVFLSHEGVRLIPIVTRYAWPSELDLMARIAGLRLKDRWAGWNREPFTSTSTTHVSVYGK